VQQSNTPNLSDAQPHTLTNARLADGRLVDISVIDGVISDIQPHDAATDGGGGSSLDLQGWLTLPAMAEPHAHLDKALTADVVPNPTGDLMGAIEAWIAASANGVFTHESTVARTTQALEKLLVNGVTAVRTHVNCTSDIGAANVRAVKEAAQAFAGLMTIEIAALPSAPLVGPEGAGARRALAETLEEGVDLVGGCPHLDPDGPGLIKFVLDVATEAGLPVDLHTDETLDPSILTLRSLARQVQETGFAHSVTASHCVSLGMQPLAVQEAVAAEVAAANISVVPLPQTNLFLQGRDHPTATPRGLTALAPLLNAGVVVAAGADNVQDPFNLVGRSDPLETAAFLVMAGHRLPDEAYGLVSNGPRQAMGLSHSVGIGVEVGTVADLVAIDATSTRSAIADAPRSRRVFHRGRLVASCDETTAVHRV